MNEWRIDGDFKKLEAIFMEKFLDDFKSLKIPKGHICKSLSIFMYFFDNKILLNLKDFEDFSVFFY